MHPAQRKTGRGSAIGLCAALCFSPASPAASVYRCVQNGTIAFTQQPSGTGCEPLDVKTYEPDPAQATKQRDELNRWREGRSKALQAARQRKAGAHPEARKTQDEETRDVPSSTEDTLRLPQELDFENPAPTNP